MDCMKIVAFAVAIALVVPSIISWVINIKSYLLQKRNAEMLKALNNEPFLKAVSKFAEQSSKVPFVELRGAEFHERRIKEEDLLEYMKIQSAFFRRRANKDKDTSESH